MRRGDVFLADLDPVQGSEQAGRRPVIIVSQDAINRTSTVILAVPCTSVKPGRRIYPSEVLIRAPEGGLASDSIAMADQVRALAATRLLHPVGSVTSATLKQVNTALKRALDLR